jgi:hypothetical protein
MANHLAPPHRRPVAVWNEAERFRLGGSRCAWAFGSSAIVAPKCLRYVEPEVSEHDQYNLGGDP